MRDEDKPFVCYRQNKWIFQITPRSAKGWRGFGMWLVPYLAATGMVVAIVAVMDKKGASATAINLIVTVPFLIGTVMWSVFMIRWMLARSEIIDTNEVMKIKREQDRIRKRLGR
jgi:hypothetical protein